jgi:glucose-1-phosphate thymidylyltransferase
MKKVRITGVVPAAGRGTRLWPYPCPKELFPIGYEEYNINGMIQKRPKVISHYLIERMVAAGAYRIIFILGENKQDVMRYYGDGRRFNAEIVYRYQEEPKGMPYALDLARNLAAGDVVIFGMPDVIFDPKDAFAQLLDRHFADQNDLTLGLFPTTTPQKFGMVELDAEGHVTSVIDKPQRTTLKYLWGLAVWSDAFANELSKFIDMNRASEQEIVLGDAFGLAINDGLKVKGTIFQTGRYIDIGTPEGLDEAIRTFSILTAIEATSGPA